MWWCCPDTTSPWPGKGQLKAMYAKAVWKEGNIEEEGVIPDKWIDREKKIVKWPQMSSTKTEKAMKDRITPQPDWLTFPLVKVKFTSDNRRECENYDLTSQAEDDNEEDVCVLKRTRTKKKLPADFVRNGLSDSDEEDGDRALGVELPNFPAPPPKVQNTAEPDMSSLGVELPTFPAPPPKVHPTQKNTAESFLNMSYIAEKHPPQDTAVLDNSLCMSSPGSRHPAQRRSRSRSQHRFVTRRRTRSGSSSDGTSTNSSGSSKIHHRPRPNAESGGERAHSTERRGFSGTPSSWRDGSPRNHRPRPNAESGGERAYSTERRGFSGTPRSWRDGSPRNHRPRPNAESGGERAYSTERRGFSGTPSSWRDRSPRNHRPRPNAESGGERAYSTERRGFSGTPSSWRDRSPRNHRPRPNAESGGERAHSTERRGFSGTPRSWRDGSPRNHRPRPNAESGGERAYSTERRGFSGTPRSWRDGSPRNHRQRPNAESGGERAHSTERRGFSGTPRSWRDGSPRNHRPRPNAESGGERAHSTERRGFSGTPSSWRDRSPRNHRPRPNAGSGSGKWAFPMPWDVYQKKVLGLLLDLRNHYKMAQPTSSTVIERMNTMEEFDESEEQLSEKETFDALVKKIAKIGGKTTKDCVHKVLDGLFTNTLMSHFNMKGRGKKGKKPLETTRIYRAIQDGVMQFDQTATAELIKTYAQEHLKHAPQRRGGGGFTSP
ncbi:uncharacterized protein si:dkey-242h9.3 isoform X2 [Engraulis encrasicolus]|uniref:uncharacterized protein si:dkey-242h9.3 isoform X2 n=1 Tax=Engraulis encrasicolus TaxID=184585 RepID=UPI002FD63970